MPAGKGSGDYGGAEVFVGDNANNNYTNKLVITYNYNNANMLTSLTNKNGDGTTLSSYSYSYRGGYLIE